jgi:Pirin
MLRVWFCGPCRTHPHRNAEIFSYVVDGELTHADSLGNRESLPRGCVQYLSAGTGISHSVRGVAAPWFRVWPLSLPFLRASSVKGQAYGER